MYTLNGHPFFSPVVNFVPTLTAAAPGQITASSAERHLFFLFVFSSLQFSPPVMAYLEDHAGSVVFSLIYTHLVSDMNKYETNHLKAPEAYFTVNELSAFNGGRSLYVWRRILVSEGSLWAKILTPKRKGQNILQTMKQSCVPAPSVYVKKYSRTPFLLLP